MSLNNILDQYKLNKALVWRAIDNTIYLDNPNVKLENLTYNTPIMNAQLWNESIHNEKSKSASASDPAAISEVFSGPFADLANDMFSQLHAAKEARDRSKVASIITSQDYTVLQDAIVLGESMDAIKTGVLLQLWDEVPVPNLKGEWIDWTTGVDYFTNVPEGSLPEPTKGTASAVEYTVPKHAGGVAITEMAQSIINGANVFQKQIAELQRMRLKKENALVATELETASNTAAGVDVGATSGTPPLSTQRPETIWTTYVDTFDTAGGTFNAIASKNNVYNEYINNDFVKGAYVPVNSPTVNEMVGPTPKLEGVTWYRDNAISLGTKVWVMDRNLAGKIFRAAVRSVQIDSPKTESTEYYLKSYMLPEIVDNAFIYELTGMTA